MKVRGAQGVQGVRKQSTWGTFWELAEFGGRSFQGASQRPEATGTASTVATEGLH